jgi:hypothetical protein
MRKSLSILSKAILGLLALFLFETGVAGIPSSIDQQVSWLGPTWIARIIASIIGLAAVALIAGPRRIDEWARHLHIGFLRFPSLEQSTEGGRMGVYLPDVPSTRHPLRDEHGRSLGRDAVYSHIAVSSRGGTTIHGCRVLLTRVDKAIAGEYVAQDSFTRTLRMKWAGEPFESEHAERLDIEPDRPRLLDVLYADQARPGIASIVTLDRNPDGVPKELDPGPYRMTVECRAEDAPPADFTFLAMVTEGFGVSLSDYIGPPLESVRIPTLYRGTTGPQATSATYGGGTIQATAWVGATEASPDIRIADEPPQVEIHSGPSARYLDTQYVLHIRVVNLGRQANFSAQVTSNFDGLDRLYGRSNELVWERPQASEKRLGNAEEGLLRLAAFEDVDEGRVVRFFAVPEWRHQDQSRGYLETMPYPLAADSLTFDLCVRNVTLDLVYRRKACVTFGTDGQPMLELTELTG